MPATPQPGCPTPEKPGPITQQQPQLPTSQQPGPPTPQEPGPPTPQEPGPPTPQQPGPPAPQQPGPPTPQQPRPPAPQQPGPPTTDGEGHSKQQQKHEDSPGDKEDIQKTQQGIPGIDGGKSQTTTKVVSEDEGSEEFTTPPSGNSRSNTPEPDSKIVSDNHVDQKGNASDYSLQNEVDSNPSGEKNQGSESKDPSLKETGSQHTPSSEISTNLVGKNQTFTIVDGASANVDTKPSDTDADKAENGSPQVHQTEKPPSGLCTSNTFKEGSTCK